MGKLLLANGAPFQQPEWSALALMESPEHVTEAHHQFLDAGADVLITNNYAVAPYHLGEERFDERCDELVDLAGRLARDAADSIGRPVRVAGSLPPMFGSYEPQLFEPERSPALMRRIADALAPHVDLFLAETQSLVAEARVCAEAAAAHDKPVWLSFTLVDRLVDGAPVLRSDESIEEAAALAADVDAEALLFNCSQPEVMGPAIETARRLLADDVAVGVYANAFETDADVEEDEYHANATIFDHRADLEDGGYTRFAEEWIAAGATIVGGCCGIMPRHIALLDALRH